MVANTTLILGWCLLFLGKNVVMKKVLIAFILGVSFVSYSQNKYLSMSVGYGIGYPGNDGVEVVESVKGNQTQTLKHLNFGGGLNVEVTHGKPLNKNAHFEFSVGYQNNLGSSIHNTYYRSEINSANQEVTVEDNSIRTFYANSYRIATGFRFTAGEGNTRAFVRMAPQLIYAKVKGEYFLESSLQEIESTDEYSWDLTLGFFGALGVEFNMNERMVFTSAIHLSFATYTPNEWEITMYEVDGRDVLSRIDLADKEVVFSKEIDEEPSHTSVYSPTRALKTRMDYSSIGLNVGVRFLL